MKTNLANWLSALCAILLIVLLVLQTKQKSQLETFRQDHQAFASATKQRQQEAHDAVSKLAGQVTNLGASMETWLTESKQQAEAFLIPLNRAVWASDTFEAKTVEILRSQMPYLDADEARRLAQGIQSTAKTAEDALAQSSFKNFTAIEAAKSGTAGVLIAVPVEITFQLINGGQVDWQRVAGVGVLAGGSAAIGSTLGNATTFALLRTEAGYSASSAVAELVGLRSASHFANGAGGFVGGGATAILFAYGGYCLGYYDLQTANRSAVAGVGGVGAGAAASAVTLGLISTYATAGTGVAISSLSGASATSASLAWLGGGSVASGGFGVFGGGIVLGTGVGAIIVGVTAAVMYGFHASDEHEDDIRLSKTIEYLSSKPTFFISNVQNYGGSR